MGLKKLRHSSQLSLQISAYYLIFLYFGSIFVGGIYKVFTSSMELFHLESSFHSVSGTE